MERHANLRQAVEEMAEALNTAQAAQSEAEAAMVRNPTNEEAQTRYSRAALHLMGMKRAHELATESLNRAIAWDTSAERAAKLRGALTAAGSELPNSLAGVMVGAEKIDQGLQLLAAGVSELAGAVDASRAVAMKAHQLAVDQYSFRDKRQQQEAHHDVGFAVLNIVPTVANSLASRFVEAVAPLGSRMFHDIGPRIDTPFGVAESAGQMVERCRGYVRHVIAERTGHDIEGTNADGATSRFRVVADELFYSARGVKLSKGDEIVMPATTPTGSSLERLPDEKPAKQTKSPSK